ncbi:hypothetical protein BS47DRAFT_1139681 [Hydnum rufescens UP504]|uniref:F-box domain-containing protein n=1 Tax=Hydnum rufescens UP504 TaxID=1448309 RepID=A0A9P6DVJ8_9AGAM|nr:hypothetical protein BS47DRAFT_1139681 [Hydnum rufescens UP504]
MLLSLFTLPLEILTQIFALLEGYQISKCGAVCTYFKHVIESLILLQYFIKLDMFGYTYGSGYLGAPAVAGTRLNQLESTSTLESSKLGGISRSYPALGKWLRFTLSRNLSKVRS